MCNQRHPAGMKLLKIDGKTGFVVIPIDKFIKIITSNSNCVVTFYAEETNLIQSLIIDPTTIPDLVRRANELLS